VFIETVTESKIYHIYKVVLLTIKITTRNISEAHNQSTNKAIKNIIMIGHISPDRLISFIN
jgi:hypothetical protein